MRDRTLEIRCDCSGCRSICYGPNVDASAAAAAVHRWRLLLRRSLVPMWRPQPAVQAGRCSCGAPMECCAAVRSMAARERSARAEAGGGGLQKGLAEAHARGRCATKQDGGACGVAPMPGCPNPATLPTAASRAVALLPSIISFIFHTLCECGAVPVWRVGPTNILVCKNVTP